MSEPGPDDEVAPGHAADGRNRAAVTSVVVAVIGLVFGLTSWIFALAFVCGTVAILTGLIGHRVGGPRRTLGIVGAATGGVLVVYSLLFGWVLADGFCVFSSDPGAEPCDSPSDWLTNWHFEGRHARNAIPAGLAELESGLWEELPESLSIYHDDGVGAAERKFIRDDPDSFLGLGGHEAVWNPDTMALIDRGPYRATYNYVNPGGILRGAGHLIFDVVPYWFGGTERGDEGTTFWQRVTGKAPGEDSYVSSIALAAAATAVAGAGFYALRRRRRTRAVGSPSGEPDPGLSVDL